MVLAEIPPGSACSITEMPDLPYAQERGLKIGTRLKVISRSSYGTMRVQLQEANTPEFLMRTIIAEMIGVVQPEQ